MKRHNDTSGPKQNITVGEGAYQFNIEATPREMFMLLQQAWNMRECVRMLTPGISGQQFRRTVDPRWIDDNNAALDRMLKDVGVKLQRARQLFAPGNCPDLIVPHVVLETEPSDRILGKRYKE